MKIQAKQNLAIYKHFNCPKSCTFQKAIQIKQYYKTTHKMHKKNLAIKMTKKEKIYFIIHCF